MWACRSMRQRIHGQARKGRGGGAHLCTRSTAVHAWPGMLRRSEAAGMAVIQSEIATQGAAAAVVNVGAL